MVFMAYLAPLYESSSSLSYFETDLGIKAPIQGGSGDNIAEGFIGLLQFYFCL